MILKSSSWAKGGFCFLQGCCLGGSGLIAFSPVSCGELDSDQTDQFGRLEPLSHSAVTPLQQPHHQLQNLGNNSRASCLLGDGLGWMHLKSVFPCRNKTVTCAS